MAADAGRGERLVSRGLPAREAADRVAALLAEIRAPASRAVMRGPLTVDFASRRVEVGGTPLELTVAEFKILHALAMAAGRIMSQRDLASALGARRGSRASRSIGGPSSGSATSWVPLAGCSRRIDATGIGCGLSRHRDTSVAQRGRIWTSGIECSGTPDTGPMNRLFLILILSVAVPFLAVPHSLSAQASGLTGMLAGKVIDERTAQPLRDASIQIVGTPAPGVQARTGIDGLYRIPGIRPGTITILVRRLGYTPKNVTGLFINAGQTIEQDVALSPASVQLTEQVVTATKERGTVNDAIDAQRTAVGVVNSVTAEQIAKSPDGDAAQAVKRVSGVTVQDGKYVFVRGLGERYTTSSLERRARAEPRAGEARRAARHVSRRACCRRSRRRRRSRPTSRATSAARSWTSRRRSFPRVAAARCSWGAATRPARRSERHSSATTVGGESFAMVNHQRDLPAIVRSLGNLQNINLNQGDVNLLVGSFRNSWTPKLGTGAPLLNGSASFGGNDPVLFGHRVGYLVSGSISSGTDVKDGQVRALADRGTTKGETVEIDRFTGQTASQGVLWGGLTNLSTLLGDGSRVSRSTACSIARPTTTRASRPARSRRTRCR